MVEVWEALGGVKVVELHSGVHKPVRAFLLPHGDGYVLVDTGYPDTVDQLYPMVENTMYRKLF
ncbi:MAG: hypothetical protein RMI49_01580 [Candidatus Caldarchaeum sp.]|nr:hypothetical protein [Candidatus Caldarchaeum sp.]